ncbi:MAG TPA: GNAT family N-acetyltransferase [Dissulfurispiraceae bacterium]
MPLITDRPSLALEEITDTASLEAMRPEWSGLWERCPSATPFQSPEWLLPWWRHFGNDNPFVLALRMQGRLVGLAPLFIFRNRDSGTLQVSLMGSGITDYLDFLLEADIASAGTRMVFEHLLSRKSMWGLCVFEELRADSPLLYPMDMPGLTTEISALAVCPVLALPSTAKEFRAGLTARFRKRLRYAQNNFTRAGGMGTELADESTLPEFLPVLFDLHRAVWRQRGQNGVLADTALRKFHEEVSAGFLERGWLRLRVLRLGGRIIAALYSFAAGGRLYCYLSGFDPGAAQFSPGKIIIWLAIENAISERMREFDFLRGREEYKYLWGPVDRINYRIRVRHE